MTGVRLTALIYAGLVAVAAMFFVTALGFPPALSSGDIGPARFPQGVAIFLIVLTSIEWVVGRKSWPEVHRADFVPTFIVGAYASAVVLLAGVVGFFVIVPPALFGALWLLGERRLALMAAYSIGFTLFLWLFFSYALNEPIGAFGA